jgi:hypothetical protein
MNIINIENEEFSEVKNQTEKEVKEEREENKFIQKEEISDLRMKLLVSKVNEYYLIEKECINLLKSNEEMLFYSHTDYDLIIYREKNMKYLQEKLILLLQIKEDIRMVDPDNILLMKDLPNEENIETHFKELRINFEELERKEAELDEKTLKEKDNEKEKEKEDKKEDIKEEEIIIQEIDL